MARAPQPRAGTVGLGLMLGLGALIGCADSSGGTASDATSQIEAGAGGLSFIDATTGTTAAVGDAAADVLAAADGVSAAVDSSPVAVDGTADAVSPGDSVLLALDGTVDATTISDAEGGDATEGGDVARLDSTCTPDTDKDTVCDDFDQCPGKDDRVDLNGDTVPDCAQNMLTNGQFTTDLSGWAWTEPYEQPSWLSEDAYESNVSGAARVVNALEASLRTTAGLSQCVPVQASTTYKLYAQFLVPPGQVENPPGGFSVFTYASATCEGAILQPFQASSGTIPVGAWRLLSYEFTTAPETQSVIIRLNVSKSADLGPIAVLYDDVLLMR